MFRAGSLRTTPVLWVSRDSIRAAKNIPVTTIIAVRRPSIPDLLADRREQQLLLPDCRITPARIP
jgi:hypothetical protein